MYIEWYRMIVSYIYMCLVEYVLIVVYVVDVSYVYKS